MKIVAVIEKNNTNFFQISTDSIVEKCSFSGYGDSVAEAKEDFMECIEEMKELTLEQGGNWPDTIEVEYTYDIPSLFNFLDWINVSKFARIVGINESKMRQYRNGICNASEKTTQKIFEGIKKLSQEMQSAAM